MARKSKGPRSGNPDPEVDKLTNLSAEVQKLADEYPNSPKGDALHKAAVLIAYAILLSGCTAAYVLDEGTREFVDGGLRFSWK